MMCVFRKPYKKEKKECLGKDWNSGDELELEFEAKLNMMHER